MVRAKFWKFLNKSYLTKIFKSRARKLYILPQNKASLHNNVRFELKMTKIDITTRVAGINYKRNIFFLFFSIEAKP